MSVTSLRRIGQSLVCLLSVLLASCVTLGGTAPNDDERLIRRYYETFAVERGGQCTHERITAITEREVIDSTADRLELRLRYAFEPFHVGESADKARCSGFATRRFVLQKGEDGMQVTYMSGWQYKARGAEIGGVRLPVRVPPVLGGVVYKP